MRIEIKKIAQSPFINGNKRAAFNGCDDLPNQ